MRALVLFVIAYAVWALLIYPGDLCSWLVGLGVAAVVALIVRELSADRLGRWLNPARYLWGIAYLFVFGWYVLLANLDVAYRVLHPDTPIRPGIVKVKTSLRTAGALTALANSITLTPGTLTVDLTADGTLYVHWINVRGDTGEEMAARILGRFEWFLKRIFE